MLQMLTLPTVIYGTGSDTRPGSFPVHVPLPILAGDPVEAWPNLSPATFAYHPKVPSLHGNGLIFGRVIMPDGPLQQVARQAYCDLFDFIDRAHPDHALLRLWNYIPDITATGEAGIERYRAFNIGRHEAFALRRAGVHNPPAATGIGTFGGGLVLYFLAGDRPGQPIENPRQVSAYNYPAQYGPRSPSFSRSLLADTSEGRMFFISGTASIVGHETRHVGDVGAQARETVTNLNALLAEATKQDFTADAAATHLKVYVRHPAHLGTIRHEVEAAFPEASALYLHAEICRPELLVEIEAVVPGR